MESTPSCTLSYNVLLTSTKTGLWCDSCIMNGHKNYFNSTCSVNRAVQKPLQNLMMLPFLILFSSQLCIHPGMSWFLHLLSPSIYKKVARIGQPHLLQRTVCWDEDNRDLMKLRWEQQLCTCITLFCTFFAVTAQLQSEMTKFWVDLRTGMARR